MQPINNLLLRSSKVKQAASVIVCSSGLLITLLKYVRNAARYFKLYHVGQINLLMVSFIKLRSLVVAISYFAPARVANFNYALYILALCNSFHKKYKQGTRVLIRMLFSADFIETFSV